MNTSFEHIKNITGIADKELNIYDQKDCIVCDEIRSNCNNSLFKDVENCKSFKHNKELEGYWTEVKKVIYENKYPWMNEEGTAPIKGSDCTSYYLGELNDDYAHKVYYISCWAKGMSAEESVSEFFKHEAE